MASSTTTANLSNILKTHYVKLKRDGLYNAAPLLALLTHVKDFVGEDRKVPVRYTNEPGGSATFGKALANRGPSGYVRFSVTRRKDYAIGSIATEMVRASEGNEAALISAVDSVITGLKNTQKRSLVKSLYGNGGGSRGTVGSGHGSSTIVLANPKDIVFFEPGMVLDGSTDDGTTGSVIVGGAAAKIVSVDRDAGSFTNDGSANWNAGTGINGLAATDDLFRQGDFGAVLHGLDAWIPATVANTAFFGVDRTTDSERLAGCRITPTTTGFAYGTIEDACLAILERVYQAGGSPDHIFVHPSRFRQLVRELGARRTYCDVKTEVGVGFRAIMIEGAGGPCKVVADPNSQRDVLWALTLDTWTLATLGDMMSVLDDKGTEPWIKEGDDDAIQMRMATYGNLYCDAPGLNGRASLSGI